jgi:CBS domain-containing protein
VAASERKSLIIEELIESARWKGSSPEALAWLGELLQTEGVDITEVQTEELERGTPVYVNAEADALDIQSLMARLHIRMLPVVKDGRVLGVIDLVELAQLDLAQLDLAVADDEAV